MHLYVSVFQLIKAWFSEVFNMSHYHKYNSGTYILTQVQKAFSKHSMPSKISDPHELLNTRISNLSSFLFLNTSVLKGSLLKTVCLFLEMGGGFLTSFYKPDLQKQSRFWTNSARVAKLYANLHPPASGWLFFFFPVRHMLEKLTGTLVTVVIQPGFSVFDLKSDMHKNHALWSYEVGHSRILIRN